MLKQRGGDGGEEGRCKYYILARREGRCALLNAIYYALLQWKNRKLWEIKVKGASRKRGENKKKILYRCSGEEGGRIYVFRWVGIRRRVAEYL